jgi:L-methionine (R)-S-oxide reductase
MFVLKPIEGDKDVVYPEIIAQAKALIHEEKDSLANMANLSSLLYHLMKDVNWVGFYLYRDNQLILGPFQGKPACVRIPIGKGVCGTTAEKRETVIVQDVHQFPGHIACDAASQSEIVVPILIDNRLIGVLDIDSPVKNRFDETDQKYLEQIVELLIKECDWQ